MFNQRKATAGQAILSRHSLGKGGPIYRQSEGCPAEVKWTKWIQTKADSSWSMFTSSKANPVHKSIIRVFPKIQINAWTNTTRVNANTLLNSAPGNWWLRSNLKMRKQRSSLKSTSNQVPVALFRNGIFGHNDLRPHQLPRQSTSLNPSIIPKHHLIHLTDIIE